MEKVGATDSVGDEADDRDEVRCIGLRATGGGAFFDAELVVEADRRRSDVDPGREAVEALSKEIWARFLGIVDIPTPDSRDGSGRLQTPLVAFEFELRGFGGGGATVRFACCRGVDILGTVTQSGSSVGVYGFDGRLGFGIRPCCGGLRADRAG